MSRGDVQHTQGPMDCFVWYFTLLLINSLSVDAPMPHRDIAAVISMGFNKGACLQTTLVEINSIVF